MPKVDTLQVNVWEPIFAAEDQLVVTRFQISPDAQETLTSWSREKARRSENQPMSVILRGLAEITSWFVPEVAFVREEWDGSVQRNRLSFYLVGDLAGDADLRRRMRAAVHLWVNTLYTDKPAETRADIAACAESSDGWAVLAVSCALEPRKGACPSPREALYWEALAAHAAQRLAGQPLRFASGESRILIPRTAQSTAFGGLELVAFPPRRGTDKGLWSEVITLRTATFPERGAIHLLVRPSIRNWGTVTRYASRQAPQRSLDIFTPAEEAFGHATRRHTSFAFRARRGPESGDSAPPGVVGYWSHKDDEKVLHLLRRLTNRSALAPDELIAPIIDQEGLWVLPRLGTLHKDKYLPGGTGIAWPDRKDIGDSLNDVLGKAGFRRAAPLTRRATKLKLQDSFHGDVASARRSVLDAVAANDGSSGLSLYVFHVREATPNRVVNLLINQFGPPDQRVGHELSWADGLTIRVKSVAADILAAELPSPDVTPDEAKTLNERQLRSLRNLKRDEAREAVVGQMTAHIRAARATETGVACALVEMPGALRDKPKQDPFQLTRRELARHDILPQIVLVDTKAELEADSATTAAKKKAERADNEKYAAAVRDCFRMLGVLPLDLLPNAFSPAALTIVQRNAESVGMGSRDSQAIPLAARLNGKRLECATPDDNGIPLWTPYARAALRILKGDDGKFGRGRQPDNVTRFHEFFATALETIERAGPALVIAEGETIRHKVKAFTNGDLTFDRLELGATVLTLQDTTKIRLVRVSPDPARQPFYYHEADNKWVSGLFGWDAACRTFYALKTKPASVSHRQSFASMTSRHGEEGSNVKIAQVDIDRVSPQLDELCVMFHQPDDDPLALATMVDRLRGTHVQTRVDTANPFPLHELRLLGGGITF
jgi:hypothetical protein